MSTSRDTIKQARVTVGCVCLLLLAIALYLYFLYMSVVQVVARTEFKQDQSILHSEIAQLESSYIEAQHIIAARIATLEGYNTDTPKVFVSREEASLVLRDQ